MTCLITGGTGNVGSFVTKLLAQGGERVVVYDIAPDIGALELVMQPEDIDKVTLVRGDILDISLLARVTKSYNVDRCVHLAAAVTTAMDANPVYNQRINIEGTNNVFDVALTCEVPKVVWASSLSVFGPRSVGSDGKVANDAPYDPGDMAGGCKVLNEVTARHYSQEYDIDVLGLRLPATYGPIAKDSWVSWIPNLIEALVTGDRAIAPQSKALMPWCYVEDIARAIVMAFDVQTDHPPAVTLVGQYESIDTVVETIRTHFTHAEIGLVGNARDDAPAAVPHKQDPVPATDPVPAKEVLGWESKISLEEGTDAIIEVYNNAHSLARPVVL